MQTPVENGAAGTGAHTCPEAQSACTGAAAEHARASCPHDEVGVLGVPPLGVQLPPVAVGAATMALNDPICVAWHDPVTTRLPTETLHAVST
jgi:hypothetical protein